MADSQTWLKLLIPNPKALFGMMGVFAEFERSMIQDRVKTGIKRV
jgi:DNA invertase Pin-like site-specific DNA recombinase